MTKAERPPVRVILGDATSQLLQVPSGTADLVLADPPYNIGYRYENYVDDLPAAEFSAWLTEWLTAAYQALRPGGALWLFMGSEYVAELKIAANFCGFQLRRWLIWHYTFGVHQKKNFVPSHTHMLYMLKPGEPVTFNQPAIAVPSARKLVYKDKRAAAAKTPDSVWCLLPATSPEHFTPDSDTWLVSRVAGTHGERLPGVPNQLPEALVSRVVLAVTDVGNYVIDPFAGSGTTVAVCAKLGRRCDTFDISENCVNRSRERVARVLEVADGKETQV